MKNFTPVILAFVAIVNAWSLFLYSDIKEQVSKTNEILIKHISTYEIHKKD